MANLNLKGFTFFVTPCMPLYLSQLCEFFPSNHNGTKNYDFDGIRVGMKRP